jgi:hypothetical protein
METIKINKIESNGDIKCVAEYDAKFSAEYCLILYVCQYIMHCDYMNLANVKKVRNRIYFGKSNRAAYYDKDNEVYSSIAPKDRTALEGDSGSKFDYKPIEL